MHEHSVRSVVSAAVCLVWLTGATQSTQPSSSPVSQPAANEGLPPGWVGDWIGTASLSSPGRPSRAVPMELHIAPTESRERFAWRIVYGEGDQRQERPYELIVKDAAKGLFEVDEKNSIRLPMVLLDGAFYCNFEVEGSVLSATYRLEERDATDDRIIVEIVALAAPAERTGGENGAPEVRTRVPSTLQRGVLRRAPCSSRPALLP